MAHGLVRERGAVRAFLEHDRTWAAWPLCSLGNDDWPHVRLWLDQPTGAALWTLNHPWWGGAVQTFGSGPALDTLVHMATLPRRAFVRLLPEARAALDPRYRLDQLEEIVRMAVSPTSFRPTADAPAAEPLGPRHGPELARLYAGWPAARFHVGRLHRGYRYQGIRQEGQLVAVAENVLRSAEDGLAIVQGVYVHPRWRGRRLAQAVTAALTAQLFAEGARDVVLDVRATNLAALAAYTRLGYRRWGTFLGGAADAR
jgi:ribosomal protein S18 acetylase RimI-like enzyme